MLYNGYTAFAFCVLVLCSARFPSVDAAANRANGYEGVYDPGRAAGWQIRWLLVKLVVLQGFTYAAAAAHVSMSPPGVRKIVLRYLAHLHLRPGRSGGQASCAPRLRLYELLYLKVRGLSTFVEWVPSLLLLGGLGGVGGRPRFLLGGLRGVGGRPRRAARAGNIGAPARAAGAGGKGILSCCCTRPNRHCVRRVAHIAESGEGALRHDPGGVRAALSAGPGHHGLDRHRLPRLGDAQDDAQADDAQRREEIHAAEHPAHE